MAIQKLDAYSLECDKCKYQFEDCDFTIWVDKSIMIEHAHDNDWREHNGEYYCGSCSEKYAINNNDDDDQQSKTKQTIINSLHDLCSDFLYYNRKEDEILSMERLNNAVKNGDITIDEMVDVFRKNLESTFNNEE